MAIVGGTQGGTFIWDAASTQATDGGVTFVPDNLTAAATEQVITYGNVNGTSGSFALAHPGIVWGSVAFSYNDETQTLGSKWMHGHSMSPRHAALAATIDKPLLDHGAGLIYKLAPNALRMLVETNTNTHATPSSRTAKLNYRYTTGAGRWIRQITDYVTPAMFGGVSGDAAFDNSFFICWALNYIHYNNLAGSVALKYDGNYYVYGFWGEWYQGVHQVGLGAEIPCVTYFGDQGGGAGGVIDLLQTKYLANPVYYLTNGGRDPYILMSLHQTVQVQFDETTMWPVDDFCVDGNIDNNLYFLTKKVQTAATVTMAVASPGDVTLTAHGLAIDDIVVFATSGTLLTGLTAGTYYYVVQVSANTFRVSATQGGAAINFSGTQSGTHTVTASHWHTEGVAGDVSQTLRESPAYAGFFLTNQSGRYYGTGGVVYANNSTWKNMGGSPHAGAGGGVWKGTNLHFGKTISGRSFYGGQGQITNLLIDGYTRSSSWSPYSGQFMNVVQRLNTPNPWPENQSGMAFLGYRANAYIGQSDDIGPVGDPGRERYGNNCCEIVNWAGNNDGGDQAASVFNIQGNGFKLTNGMIDEGPLTGTTTIFNAASGPDGGISLSAHGFEYVNRSRGGVALLSGASTGYFEKATLNDVFLRDLSGSPFTVTIASPAVVTATAHGLVAGSTFNPETTGALPTGMVARTQYYVLATDLTANTFKFSLTAGGAAINTSGSQSGSHVYFGGSRGISDPKDLTVSVSAVLATFNMDPVPAGIPPVTRQIVEFNNLRSDVMHERLCDLQGGGDANGVPLDVYFNGGYTTTRKNKLIKSEETDTTFSSKSRFFFNNHGLNLFDPGETGRETADTVDPWIARSIMRGCYDRTTGRVSEIDEIVTYAVVSGAAGAGQVQDTVVNGAGYIDMPINLLWKPLTYSVQPLSTNAVTVGVSSVGVVYPNTTGATPDNTKPRLRVGVGTVTSGQTLTYNLRAAVAPSRDLN